jgi:hypothetical protein
MAASSFFLSIPHSVSFRQPKFDNLGFTNPSTKSDMLFVFLDKTVLDRIKPVSSNVYETSRSIFRSLEFGKIAQERPGTGVIMIGGF